MNRKGVLHVVGVAAVAVALAGCLKVDMSLEINDDESIDGHVIMAVSDGLAQLTGEDPETLAQQFEDEVMDDAPEGVTQEPYEDDEFQGTRLVSWTALRSTNSASATTRRYRSCTRATSTR
jgi:hypothetical protein